MKNPRMPTLNWIGKEAAVKHRKEVPFRLLEPVPALSCGPAADSGNLIVQGDNLHALKALLPRYAGQVKRIHIAPRTTPAMKAGLTTTTSTVLKSNAGSARWSANKARHWTGTIAGFR